MSELKPTTITKKELVNRIAEETGQTKVVVKDILQRFLDAIVTELSHGNRLEFREFGVFEVRTRAARRGQNPRTLEEVRIPPRRTVKFKGGRVMRERVGGDEEDEDEELPQAARIPETRRRSAPPMTPPATPPSNSPF